MSQPIRLESFALQTHALGLLKVHLRFHSLDENQNDSMQPEACSESLMWTVVMMTLSLQEVALDLLKVGLHLLGCGECLHGLDWW